MKKEIIDFYHEHGYAGPFVGIGHRQASEIAEWIKKELNSLPTSRIGHFVRYKLGNTTYQHERLLKTRNRHLDNSGIAELLEEDRIMDPVFSILGPDVCLWRTQIFEMDGQQGLRWHTDEYRTILDPINEQISAQIAFTPTSEENCVWVLPGSHKLNDEEIRNRFNLEYIEGSREAPAYGTSRYKEKGNMPDPVKIVMNPGEFFIFHPRCLHRSSVGSDIVKGDSRLAMAFRFASSRTQLSDAAFAQTRPRHDHALALRKEVVAA